MLKNILVTVAVLFGCAASAVAGIGPVPDGGASIGLLGLGLLGLAIAKRRL